MKTDNRILARLSVFAIGLLMFVACSRTPSQKRINKMHEKYVSTMPDVKLKEGEDLQNAEKLGDIIAWEMAADIDSLIKGLVTPQQKYGLDEMYCNTAVTTAIRDALNKTNFKELYGIDFFATAKTEDMRRGSSFIKYLQKNKEAYEAAAHVIKFADLSEEDYQNMSRGSVIFYCGNYIDAITGKKQRPYSHTQMMGGKGFSDDVKGKENGVNPMGTMFAPSNNGGPITINAYGNGYRQAGDNKEIYEDRKDVNLDEVLVVDTNEYLKVLMRQSSQRQI